VCNYLKYFEGFDELKLIKFQLNIFPIKNKYWLKKKRSNITASILSGGNSSRIGTNKSLLLIEGTTLIQRLVELLDSIFTEVVISSNEPESYEFFGKKIISDIFPQRGPLSGIHSALSFTNSRKNFIISCDMPFISYEMINYLMDTKSDSEIVIPKAQGRIQPLCGIYSKSILPIVENLLIESIRPESKLKGSVYELFNRVKIEFVEVDKLNFYHKNLFFNINTPEDYNLAKRILEQK
jgi:molybdopterin-guanine dinucleotide biosynthesis protein A